MSDLETFITQMISSSGISAYEEPIREIINSKWLSLADEISISRLGSLHALCKGSGSLPRRKILLAAHMDAVGLMVTGVVDEFLRFTSVGAIDPRILPGQPVFVFGREELPGIIIKPPDHHLPSKYLEKTIPIEYLFIDVGLTPEETAKLVRSGDVIAFANPPCRLFGETISGHTLDDRAGVAAVTHCMELLKSRVHLWDVWAVATTQEEAHYEGAYTSTYSIQPDIGISIDVCVAQGPGAAESALSKLEGGVSIGILSDSHPYFSKTLVVTAEKLGIPYEIDTFAVRPLHSATDAYAIQITGKGIATAVVSIPLRYMHTPVELVSQKDIRSVGCLLAEFITSLDDDFLEKINWDNL